MTQRVMRLADSLRDPRVALAQGLVQQGMSTAPVGHWTQGLARLAQTMAGLYGQHKIRGEQQAVAEALAGMGGAGAPMGQDENARLLAEMQADNEALTGVPATPGETAGYAQGLGMGAPMGGGQPNTPKTDALRRLQALPPSPYRDQEILNQMQIQREAQAKADEEKRAMDTWREQFDITQGAKKEETEAERAWKEQQAEQKRQDDINKIIWGAAYKPENLVPGRDVPLDPKVYEQKIEIAKAGKEFASPYQQFQIQKGTQEMEAKKVPERKPPESLNVPFVRQTPWDTMPESEKPAMMRSVYLQEKKLLGDMDKGLAQSRDMNKQLKRFKYLNSKEPTGGILDRMTEFSMDPEKREMVAITNKITPLMRQGMPGAASDRDVAMFRGATVGIGNTKEINESIITGASTMVENSEDRLKFMREYLKTNKHLEGAEDYWNSYLQDNPIFDPDAPEGSYILNDDRKSWKDYFKGGKLSKQTAVDLPPPPPGAEIQ